MGNEINKNPCQSATNLVFVCDEHLYRSLEPHLFCEQLYNFYRFFLL